MSEQSLSLTEALRWPAFLHPLDQAAWWSSVPMYDWQQEVLEAAAEPRSRVIVATCNESGKTSLLIPCFGLAVMVAFPGAFVYSTSGSERQVREQLFINQLEPLIQELPGWEVSVSRENMHVTSPTRYGMRSRWIGYKCARGGNVEGFHGKWQRCSDGKVRYRPCCYIIDEAKSVSDDIFEAVVRIDPDFLLAVSTPGAEEGWFYRGIDPDSIEGYTKAQEAETMKQLTDDELKQRIATLEGIMAKKKEE